jgi:hypothetical protein
MHHGAPAHYPKPPRYALPLKGGKSDRLLSRKRERIEVRGFAGIQSKIINCEAVKTLISSHLRGESQIIWILASAVMT